MEYADIIQSLATVVTLILSLAYTIIRLSMVFSKVVDDAQTHLRDATEKMNDFQNKILDFVQGIFQKQ